MVMVSCSRPLVGAFDPSANRMSGQSLEEAFALQCSTTGVPMKDRTAPVSSNARKTLPLKKTSRRMRFSDIRGSFRTVINASGVADEAIEGESCSCLSFEQPSVRFPHSYRRTPLWWFLFSHKANKTEAKILGIAVAYGLDPRSGNRKAS